MKEFDEKKKRLKHKKIVLTKLPSTLFWKKSFSFYFEIVKIVQIARTEANIKMLSFTLADLKKIYEEEHAKMKTCNKRKKDIG